MQGGETEGEIRPQLLTSDDRWILLWQPSDQEVTAAFEAIHRRHGHTLPVFLERILRLVHRVLQGDVFGEDADRKANVLAVVDFVMGNTLLFHPFLPFITESCGRS